MYFFNKNFRYLKYGGTEPYKAFLGVGKLPYISLTYSLYNIGEYLHFRYLKSLVIFAGNVCEDVEHLNYKAIASSLAQGLYKSIDMRAVISTFTLMTHV